jgi:predicted dehydrogenase
LPIWFDQIAGAQLPATCFGGLAEMVRFAVVGIDHGHIFDHAKGLLRAGAEFAGYCPKTSIPGLVESFAQTYPDVPQIDRAALFADPSIDVICIASIPRDRGGPGHRGDARRQGRDGR